MSSEHLLNNYSSLLQVLLSYVDHQDVHNNKSYLTMNSSSPLFKFHLELFSLVKQLHTDLSDLYAGRV